MEQFQYTRYSLKHGGYQDKNDKYSHWHMDMEGPIVKKINKYLKCMLNAIENIDVVMSQTLLGDSKLK